MNDDLDQKPVHVTKSGFQLIDDSWRWRCSSTHGPSGAPLAPHRLSCECDCILIHGRLRRYRYRSVPSGEFVGTIVVGITGLAFVEIQRVTKRIVLEFPVPGPSASGLVESPDKSLPSGSGSELRPLPDFLEAAQTPSPPGTVALGRPHLLPPRRSTVRRSAGAEAGEAEAAASPVKESSGGLRRRFRLRFFVSHAWILRRHRGIELRQP